MDGVDVRDFPSRVKGEKRPGRRDPQVEADSPRIFTMRHFIIAFAIVATGPLAKGLTLYLVSLRGR